jgi:hypothetical protein
MTHRPFRSARSISLFGICLLACSGGNDSNSSRHDENSLPEGGASSGTELSAGSSGVTTDAGSTSLGGQSGSGGVGGTLVAAAGQATTANGGASGSRGSAAGATSAVAGAAGATTLTGALCQGGKRPFTCPEGMFDHDADPTTPCVRRARLSVGNVHVCFIDLGGMLHCWGDNSSGQSDVPADLGRVLAVSAGLAHTCVVTAENKVRCWGNNSGGRIDVPSGLVNVVQVSTYAFHTCAVDSVGAVTCWGDNETQECDVPAQLGPVAQVYVTESQTCALDLTGKVTCWGNGGWAPDNWTCVARLALGRSNRCVVDTNGVVSCSGSYTSLVNNIPAGLGAVVSVELGGCFACALNQNSKLICWGNASCLTGGWGTTNPPVLRPVKDYSTGPETTCAIDDQDKVTCWGRGLEGQTNVPKEFAAK